MNIDTAFSSYLKAADMDKPYRLTIDRVVEEEVGTDMKPVVYFAGAQKGLVLNVTNGNAIKEIAGSAETDDWGGTQVELYSSTTQFQGKTVPCVRVRFPNSQRPTAPVQEPVYQEPEPEPLPPGAEYGAGDDIPF